MYVSWRRFLLSGVRREAAAGHLLRRCRKWSDRELREGARRGPRAAARQHRDARGRRYVRPRGTRREAIRARAESPEPPARRFGQPEDIAHAIVFLMTNPYVTGQTLYRSWLATVEESQKAELRGLPAELNRALG